MHTNPRPHPACMHMFSCLSIMSFLWKEKGQSALEILEWKPKHLEILFSELSLADFFLQRTSPEVTNNGFVRCKEFVQCIPTCFLWRHIASMLTYVPINLRSRVVNCCLDEASLFSFPLKEVGITVLTAYFPVYYYFVTGKHMELDHKSETSPNSKVSILYF